VVADLFLSETAARADVVLPSAQWAEEEGTMTNLEGRVLLRRRAQAPPEGVRTDAEILVALAGLLGRGHLFPTSEPRAVFDELRRASAGGAADYNGITYERIAAENGVFWPCPDEGHPGTPRLFLERFATPDGRARFRPVAHGPAAEEPDGEFPLYLTTGRVMGQYQSGTQTRRVRELNEAAPGPFVEMHPAPAARLGIADGDPVRLTTRRGAVVAPARLTPTIRQDTLFVPFHWAGPAARTCSPIPRSTPPRACPSSRSAPRGSSRPRRRRRTPPPTERRGSEPRPSPAKWKEDRCTDTSPASRQPDWLPLSPHRPRPPAPRARRSPTSRKTTGPTRRSAASPTRGC
jgi:assimilatory nitrate reductase catalytic subunit